MIDRRIAIALAAVVAVAVLFFLLRPEDDEGERTTAGTTAGTTTQAEPPQFEPLPTVATPPEETWQIDATDDALDRRTVKQDTRLTIRVVTDTADEVHVHGYDLTAQVSPGNQVTIFVRTAITGRFEIELENSHRQIAQLTVTP